MDLVDLPLKSEEKKEYEMRKFLSKSVLAGMGIMMAASVSQATDVKMYPGADAAITGDGAPMLIANEALTSAGLAAVDVGDIVLLDNGSLVITTSVLSPASIELSFAANAAIEAATANEYHLAIWTDDAAADGAIQQSELTAVVTDNLGTTAVGVVADGTLTFTPDAGAVLNAGAGVDLPVGSKLVVITDNNADATDIANGGLNFSIDAGTALDSSLTLNVSEGGGVAGSAVVAQAMNQYVLCNTSDKFDAMINLKADPSDTQFVVGGGAVDATHDVAGISLTSRDTVDTTSCGDSTNMSGQFIVKQDAAGGSIDELVGKLTGSDQAISGMADAGAAAIAYADGGWISPIVDVSAGGGGALFTFAATVDGTTAIDARSFGFNVVSTPEANFTAITYEYNEGHSAGAWGSTGYVGHTPYVPFGFDGYTAFFKIANNSNVDGPITVTGVCQNLTDGVDVPSVTGSAGTIQAGTLMTLGQGTMATALGLDEAKDYHCDISVAVGVSSSSITMGAYQSDPVGRTMLPVYTNYSRQ